MISPVTVFTIKCCKVLLFVSSSILLDNILGDIFRQIGETRMLTNLILTKKMLTNICFSAKLCQRYTRS